MALGHRASRIGPTGSVRARRTCGSTHRAAFAGRLSPSDHPAAAVAKGKQPTEVGTGDCREFACHRPRPSARPRVAQGVRRGPCPCRGLFDPSLTWGGPPLMRWVYRVVRESYPQLDATQVQALGAALHRVYLARHKHGARALAVTPAVADSVNEPAWRRAGRGGAWAGRPRCVRARSIAGRSGIAASFFGSLPQFGPRSSPPRRTRPCQRHRNGKPRPAPGSAGGC